VTQQTIFLFDSYDTDHFPDADDPFPDDSTAGLWDFDSVNVVDETVNNCDSITNWATDSYGSLSSDDVDYMEGSASVQDTVTFTAAGQGNHTYTPNLGGVDWSKKHSLRFWYKIDTTTNLSDFKVFIRTVADNWDNYLESADLKSQLVSGEWIKFEVSLDDFSVGAGSPNLSQVQRVTFRLYSSAAQTFVTHIDQIEVREHQYLDASSNGNTGYAIGAKAPNLPSSSDANIVACWNMREGGDDLYPTVWDDCEDLNNEGATWTGIRGDETVTTTTTKKYGSNAIVVKGGTNNVPGAELTFASAADWSDYKTFEVWLAPNNDDSTPATGQTARVIIYNESNYVLYDEALSSTPDEYILKKCELNSSGVGDSPDASSGTMDWSSITRVQIEIVTTTDNIDFAFDHIVLRKSMVKDETSNDNDLILPPGHSPTWTTGIDGDALSFDGSSQYADAGNVSIGGLGSITVMAWVKSSSEITSQKEIVRKDACIDLCAGLADHKACFLINDGTWKSSRNGTTDIDDGNWHHLAGVYDGTYLKIIVDGTVESSNNIGATTLATNTNHLMIGSTSSKTLFWHGKIANVAIYSADASSNLSALKTNSCLVFDGSDDYVTLGNPSSLQISGSFTVSAWFRTPSAQNGAIVDMGKYDGALGLWYGFTARIWSTKLQFLVGDGDSTGYSLYSNTVISTDTWYHFAATYDDSSKITRMYINGVQEGYLTNSYAPVTDRNKYIGWSNVNSETHYDGSIDEVVIRNRVQIEDDEWVAADDTKTNVYFDPTTKYEGAGSFAIGTTSGVTNGLKKNFGGQDWSIYRTIKVWFRHDAGTTKTVRVYIKSNSDPSNYSRWDFSVPSGTWTQLKVFLPKPDANFGSGWVPTDVGDFIIEVDA